MYTRSLLVAVGMLCLSAMPSHAQTFDAPFLDKMIAGLTAEKAELDKVGTELKALDEKIEAFRQCASLLKEAGGLGGKSGLAAKVAMKAKCGATSEDGYLKDRARLYEKPEKIGAAAAGMKPGDYAGAKERLTGYLSTGEYAADGAVIKTRAEQIAALMGITPGKASNGGGGIGDRIGNRIGNAVNSRIGAFTPDMTWAYVGYLWGMMFMSGATMFETAYQPGHWTRWEIADASQEDSKVILERALLSRAADGSEWWRIKSINVYPEASDTITLESQFKKLDESGLAMQVVRMRGKLPGDTEGKELMVPQHLSMLSASAFPFKPTSESIAGATVGTESVKVGSNAFAAKHVKFGAGEGYMEWWLADKAPGGVVKIQFSGKDKDDRWTMKLTDSGAGAKSELGVK